MSIWGVDYKARMQHIVRSYVMSTYVHYLAANYLMQFESEALHKGLLEDHTKSGED